MGCQHKQSKKVPKNKADHICREMKRSEVRKAIELVGKKVKIVQMTKRRKVGNG